MSGYKLGMDDVLGLKRFPLGDSLSTNVVAPCGGVLEKMQVEVAKPEETPIEKKALVPLQDSYEQALRALREVGYVSPNGEFKPTSKLKALPPVSKNKLDELKIHFLDPMQFTAEIKGFGQQNIHVSLIKIFSVLSGKKGFSRASFVGSELLRWLGADYFRQLLFDFGFLSSIG